MIVRGVDGDNDWLYGKGKNDYKKDKLAVIQNIRTRLQSFLGDCFFAEDAGIDWFFLLGSKQQAKLRLDISATILNTADVTGLIELSTNLSDTRRITIQYSVNTTYGQVNSVFTQEVTI